MDMDLAYKVMGWLVLAFALTMFGLGHFLSGNGVEGWQAMKAQDHCDRTGAIGVKIVNLDKTYLCR